MTTLSLDGFALGTRKWAGNLTGGPRRIVARIVFELGVWQAVRALQAMPNWVLADLGITRAEIERYVRHGH